jgi:hypothetical protein
MKPDLPQVIEFDDSFDVKIEHSHGHAKIKAVPKVDFRPKYKTIYDLPFVQPQDANGKTRWFYLPEAANHAEQQARGEFCWNEFVAFARGNHKRRRADAQNAASRIIQHLFVWRECSQESETFATLMAEALVAHLRVGLDEAKSDQQLVAEEVAA